MIHVRHAAAGDRLGPLRDGAGHVWPEWALRRRSHPRCRVAHQPSQAVRAALWADGAADFVQIPVLHCMIFSVTPANAGPRGERRGPGALGSRFRGNDEIKARAIGDGLGRAAGMGGQEPARHLQVADHRRGCAELADDRLPVLEVVRRLGRRAHAH